MKSFFKDYLLEILIFIFGLIITIICAVWLSSAETATLSFVITVSTDIILLSYQLGNKSIDEKLATRIRELFLETYMAIQDDMNRVDDRWKDAANRQIEETRERIKNLSTGIREISRPESIEYQANLLKSATSEVLAIHLGDSETALRRWDEKKTTKDFSTVLINANNECKAKVKKRLFIIEGKTDVAYLSSLYTALEVQKKLGFDTRVILKKLLSDQGQSFPPDMLICDQIEVVIVTFIEKQLHATAYISDIKLKENIAIFNTLWEVGTTVTVEYLADLKRRISTQQKAARKKK